MIDALPKVSTAGSLLIKAFFFAILVTPIDKTIVTTTGRPSGIAETAREIADKQLTDVTRIADEFAAAHKDDPVDEKVDILLDDVQRDIMKLGIELEMQKGE